MSETIKLIYRAQIFEYHPPYPQDKNILKDYPTISVKLIYRAQIFERQVPLFPIYPQPKALNWRFQIPRANLLPQFQSNAIARN